MKQNMKPSKNSIDYGIYVDRKHAFVVALDHIVHEALIVEDTIENPNTAPRKTDINIQEHIQNREHEQLKKFCKEIVSKLENAQHIFIFGPSQSKYELQNEIRNSKQLQHVHEELEATDVMSRQEAIRFAMDHYTPITAGQQTFTGIKK